MVKLCCTGKRRRPNGSTVEELDAVHTNDKQERGTVPSSSSTQPLADAMESSSFRITISDAPERHSDQKPAERRSLFRRLRSGKSAKSESRRVIARSFTEYVDLPIPPDVIHGLTEENRNAYKESLIRLAETPEWACAFQSKNPPARILYKMEPGNNKIGWVYAVFWLNIGIVPALSPTIEVETWPQWNPYCTKHVKTGSSSAWHFQSHYEESMAFGAFKSEQNTRTVRWINESQGYLLQNISSVNPGEDGYIQPSRLTRQKIEADLLTMCPTPHDTLMVQLLRVESPIAIPSFVQKFAFSTLAPKILKQMANNANLVNNPKQPYMRYIEDDATGIYAHLHKLAHAEAPRPVNIIDSCKAFLDGTPVSGSVISDTMTRTTAIRKSKKRMASGIASPTSGRKLDSAISRV